LRAQPPWYLTTINHWLSNVLIVSLLFTLIAV
jgi:hypothetical protein